MHNQNRSTNFKRAIEIVSNANFKRATDRKIVLPPPWKDFKQIPLKAGTKRFSNSNQGSAAIHQRDLEIDEKLRF